MTVIWKDVTSFSQNEKDKTPRSWEARIGKFKVIVHRHIHFEKTDWLMTVEGIFEHKRLFNRAIDDAKDEALNIMADTFHDALNAMSR